jgi:bifunctional non-homologous end joining protein LigD
MPTGLLDDLPPEERRLLRTQRHPEWTDPMLATLTERRFSDPDWIFERKLDGVRALAFRRRRRVRLMSRNRKDIDRAYPEIVEALAEQSPDDAVVDGEVVAFEGRQTSFARLQGRMHLRDPDRARRSGIAVFYYVFDLLHLDGRDVTRLPLRRRKALLRSALEFHGPLRFLTHTASSTASGTTGRPARRGGRGSSPSEAPPRTRTAGPATGSSSSAWRTRSW